MEMTYSFHVPNDWPLSAKDYFRMGADDTGMAQNDGISSFLVKFAATDNFQIPRDAQQAWSYISAHLLNVMPLTDAGWEDLDVQVTGHVKESCQLRFEIDSGDGIQQQLIELSLYRDRPVRDANDIHGKFGELPTGGLASIVTSLEPISGAPLNVLANYYSPSYRKVQKPNAEVQLCLDETGQRVRRRIYCKESDFIGGPERSVVWWVEVRTFDLGEAFMERYVPLSMEDDEASVFFGHPAFEPLWNIVKATVQSIKDSLRASKARRDLFGINR